MSTGESNDMLEGSSVDPVVAQPSKQDSEEAPVTVTGNNDTICSRSKMFRQFLKKILV